MRKVQFLDTTLRDGEQTIGVNFSVEDKIKIANNLEKWGIDVIEAGFPIASTADFAAVQAVSENVKEVTVSGLARATHKDIDACVAATKSAKRKQIHIFIATSPIHRETKLHMSKEQILQKITDCISYAHQYFDIIEFSPEDATRTEPEFLVTAINTAIMAGASVINIPDTVGYTNPIEFGKLFQFLKERIPSFDEVIFSVHCHNDLGMAAANSLASITNGALRIEGTINGIGERAGNAALEEVAVALKVRQDYYQCTTNINLAETVNISKLVSDLTVMPIPNNKAIVGKNAFAHESGIHQDGMLKNPATYEILTPQMVGATATKLPLGKLSGSHAVIDRLAKLGYTIQNADIIAIFKIFKEYADHKKIIEDTDLVKIMAEFNEVVQ